MDKRKLTAHLLAIITVTVWATTFIASKKLLGIFSPLQILFMRFILAYIALWIIRPRRLKLSKKEELCFLLMGVFGGTLYFFTENTALLYTLAANVSIIVATAPILTALLAHFCTRDEKLRSSSVWGFFIAITGVVLVVYNGAFVLKVNPIGDLLSLCAAISWAVYSMLLKRFASKYDSFLVTRRTMLWGILTALPLILIEGKPLTLSALKEPTPLFCLLFLGLVGSAACYVFWATAVERLGVVKTNSYIYLVPFITIVAAALLLKEPISFAAILGAGLITAGVVVAQRRPKPEPTQNPDPEQEKSSAE
ncbi:DMT family transporter [Oscillibacter hominis]|uniref:DMT family transporter n=1 Tax=Oscillibacter hominis TaxID=2763056 RepID=A0A7G9B861_9FIRM|nr:DMT family transporter [Oscillibacter hominis]QNL45742.1 DMT family transporter [Oscillibacter hominis]